MQEQFPLSSIGGYSEAKRVLNKKKNASAIL
jgi:hypothetical protein